jgi:hypothetical protein
MLLPLTSPFIKQENLSTGLSLDVEFLLSQIVSSIKE